MSSLSSFTKETEYQGQTEGLPIIETDGSKGIITFNRPEVRNRISPEDIEAITNALDQFESDPAVRVVIFTGRGKVFSSGFNLNIFYENVVAKTPKREARAEDNFFAEFTDRIENCKLPTILAANGSVYGGATDVALACDFRFGVEGVEAFLPASRLGIHFYDRGLERFVARLGLAAAKRICLTSETLNTEELLRCGFFDAVMPEKEMWARVDKLADTLAAQAPIAVKGMKRALNQISYNELDKEATANAFSQCLNSEDFKEGVRAWFEKRRPAFKGK
ncbi:MAG: enoyl-CoA hydratase/isomerase family protein [Pseudomonadota bacterium]